MPTAAEIRAELERRKQVAAPPAAPSGNRPDPEAIKAELARRGAGGQPSFFQRQGQRMVGMGTPQTQTPVPVAAAQSAPSDRTAAPIDFGVDAGAVKDWYNGARDGVIPTWRKEQPADGPGPVPPPPLWEQRPPVNIAKALDDPFKAAIRDRMGEIGLNVPDPTQAPISEQQLNGPEAWNAARPPEPMNNLVKRAARGFTNVLADTGNTVIEGLNYAASRQGSPVDEMGNPIDIPEGAATQKEFRAPSIPKLYVPPAQDAWQAGSDVGGTIGGYVFGPGGPLSGAARAGGQALRGVNAIGNAARAITPQGSSMLAKGARFGGRMAATLPENALHAAAFGAITGGGGYDDQGNYVEGDRLGNAAAVASDPINYVAQPIAALLNRAAIFVRSGGQRVTPEFVQVQRAAEVLRRGNATADEIANASRVIDQLTPPASGAPQPSVAPIPQPAVSQPPGRGTQAGAAGAGQGGPATLQATPQPVNPAVAQDTQTILRRLLIDSNVPRNDIDRLLGELTNDYQVFQGSGSPIASRVGFGEFADQNVRQTANRLGMNMTPDVERQIQTALRGRGRSAHGSEGGSKQDRQPSIMSQYIEDMRSTQKDWAREQIEAPNAFNKSDIAVQRDAMGATAEDIGRNVYKNALAEAKDMWSGAVPMSATEKAALDKLQNYLLRKPYLNNVPDYVKLRLAVDDVPLEDAIAADPAGMAHRIQSVLGKAASEANDPAMRGALGEARDRLLTELDAAVPAYRRARADYGDEFATMRAFDFGRPFFAESRRPVDVADMKADYAKMTTRQKTAARMSVRDEIFGVFGMNAEDAAVRLEVLTRENTLNALEEVFGAPGKRVADTLRRLKEESAWLSGDKTRGLAGVDIYSGSPTVPNMKVLERDAASVRTGFQRAIAKAGDVSKFLFAIPADIALFVGTGGGYHLPMLTMGAAGGKITKGLSNVSPKKLSNATEGLFSLPKGTAAPPAPPAPRVRGPRGPRTPAPPLPTDRRALLEAYAAAPTKRERERIRRALEALGDNVPAPTAPRTPPVRSGFGGSKLPMDEASRMQRAKEQGFDVDTRWFHGTQRLDRLVGSGKLNPKRATSGPMPFFTDDPAIASRYATGKADTSMPEMADYSQAFTVSPKALGHTRSRTPYTVEQSWHFLTPEQKRTILDRVKRIGYQNFDQASGPLTLHPEGVEATLSGSHFDYLMKTEARGNPLTALRQMWLEGGNLHGAEEELKRIYQLAGYPHPISMENAPWTTAEGIMPAYLRMQKPLQTDSTDEVQRVVQQLRQEFARDRTRKVEYGADAWDKNSRFTPREWVEQLADDVAKGENSFVWTSIPDKVTDALRRMGYDGILDVGGKSGGQGHRVAIPFDARNVRSTNAAFDPAEASSSKLLAGMRPTPAATGGAIGSGVGYVANPADANQDGVIDDADRGLNALGGLVSGVVGGGVAGRAMRGRGGAPTRGRPEQGGFGGRPALDEARAKPPSRPIARTVAGGAIGGMAGTFAGESEAQSTETTSQLNAVNERIKQLEADTQIFETGSILQIQQLLQRRGKAIAADGKMGPQTAAAIQKDRDETRAELDAARKRRKDLEKQAANEATRPNDAQKALREWGPILGALAGLGLGAKLRGGAVKKAAKDAPAQIAKANALLTPGPLNKSRSVAAQAALKKQPANLNEFWQLGGSKDQVPFELTGGGKYKGRKKTDVMPPSKLFPNRRIRSMDVGVVAGGMLEGVGAQYAASALEGQIKEARLLAENEPTKANLAHVEALEDQHAIAVLMSRLGYGVAGGRLIASLKMPYRDARPDVAAADAERALLLEYLKKVK